MINEISEPEMIRYKLTSKEITLSVWAPNPIAAFMKLQHFPPERFGLVVLATPVESPADQVPIRTGVLMHLFGNPDAAEQFVETLQRVGMIDDAAAMMAQDKTEAENLRAKYFGGES